MTYEYEQYLEHSGRKGMQWGVRRYQNEDGSYTDLGRIHYGIGQKRKTSDNWQKDDASRLSDEELDRRNKRLQKEQQYRDNVRNRNPLRKETSDAAKRIFATSAVAAGAALMTGKYKDVFSRLSNKLSEKLKRRGRGTAEHTIERTAERTTSEAMRRGAERVTEEAARRSSNRGAKFLYNNRRLLGLGAGVAAYKGAEYWKKKNDQAGRDSTFSDFAYKHRGALGVAAYVAVGRIAKHIYRRQRS